MTSDELEEWSARLIGTVATEIRRYRLERGWSAQQLSFHLADNWGLDLKRSVLANLESGRRGTISLVELLILARALQVPPLLLLFPVGREQSAEPVPGEVVDTWDAAKWFMGEAPLPDIRDLNTWAENAEPISLYRTHERYVREWEDIQAKTRALLRTMSTKMRAELDKYRAEDDPRGADDALLDMLGRSLVQCEEGLAATRAEIRRRGLMPPALPNGLAHLDEPEGNK